jgi:hypothetical protein
VGHVAEKGGKRGAYRARGGGKNGRKNHLEDPGVEGRIILKWIYRKWCVGMHWIDLARNRDR